MTPLLRSAAPSAPSTPAIAHLPIRASKTAPNDSARNRDSLYTAEKKKAIGQNAVSITASRARDVLPSSSDVSL